MVAVIHHTKGFHNVLNYNENKVNEQVAVCLEAANYAKKTEQLTFTQKLKRLENQAALNERTTVNCVHISLNFDPTEQFSDDKLKEIAAVYMDKIGFGEQPYLLYRHDDSGHPHVHLVTTNIKENGRRIELHNLGKVQSEKARKEIEITYGLLRPEDSTNRQKYELNPVNVQKVQYGKAATKRAVTTVLNKVVNDYKYSSLPELNAVLKLYNITADRGTTESRIYQNHGLTYRILDADGNKTGVPIKASDIYNKPTLKVLEEKFASNEPLKQPNKSRVKNAVDWALLKHQKASLPGLMQALNKEAINMVIRQNDNGIIYGITYVDHRTKCVFNGSDLGKQYSANAIQERCGLTVAAKAKNSLLNSEQSNVSQHAGRPLLPDTSAFADALLQQEPGEMMPFELKRNKKKKRKRL
jgi:hypothetical protein